MRLDSILHPTDFSPSARPVLLHADNPAVEHPTLDAEINEARRLAEDHVEQRHAPWNVMTVRDEAPLDVTRPARRMLVLDRLLRLVVR